MSTLGIGKGLPSGAPLAPVEPDAWFVEVEKPLSFPGPSGPGTSVSHAHDRHSRLGDDERGTRRH